MTLRHHLGEDTLIRYASGELTEAFATIVAAHIAMCPSCHAALRDAEELGAALLEKETGISLSDDAFSKMMKEIDRQSLQGTLQQEAAPEKPRVAKGDVPLPLVDLIGENLDDIPWRTKAPGVQKHTIKLDHDDKASMFMLKIASGAEMPEHGHGGEELTLVLSGSYADSMGTFGRGDVADLDEHVEHQPVVNSEEPCICIVATTAPTQFKELVPRLLQPYLGI